MLKLPISVYAYIDMKTATHKLGNSVIKDILGVVGFIVLVILGTIFINAFVFRSFNVNGPSMQTTLYTSDRLIVNKIPLTWDNLWHKTYIPPRGQVIVFKNPEYNNNGVDEYIVKRVVGLPGERVVVKKGKVSVYNKQNPRGFNPDSLTEGPGHSTSGDVDRTVPKGEIFVMGDHRVGNFSLDSRNGLGTIPLNDIVGPVSLRIYPFNKVRSF